MRVYSAKKAHVFEDGWEIAGNYRLNAAFSYESGDFDRECGPIRKVEATVLRDGYLVINKVYLKPAGPLGNQVVERRTE
jgi:hypothetical protein